MKLGDENSKLNPVCLDMPSPGMQKLFRQMERNKSLIDSTGQMAVQQRVVEHEVSHPLHPDLPPEVSTHVLPLGTVRSERESKVDSANLLLTVI